MTRLHEGSYEGRGGYVGGRWVNSENTMKSALLVLLFHTCFLVKSIALGNYGEDLGYKSLDLGIEDVT